MIRYEIIANPQAMTITVGERVFDRPRLHHAPEVWFETKGMIVPQPNLVDDVPTLHRFYSEKLGPKFNRRFQAANYWLWLGGRMTRDSANMLRLRGKHWRHYDNKLVFRANDALPYVNEIERDGLTHLVPAAVTFRASPQAIRKLIGGAAWRKVAHNSKTRNRLLMQLACFGGEDGAEERFVAALDCPSGVLPAMATADPDEVATARLAPLKTWPSFTETMHYVRDAHRMIGDGFNPLWSLARIRDEHERAAREIRKRQFGADAFVDAWAWAKDGYTATLLVSPLEIAVEGDAQHHCVGSYANNAFRGEYAVLKIEGAERATLGLRRRDKRWIVDQVYGACNASVSDACAAISHRIAAALSLTQTEQRRAA